MPRILIKHITLHAARRNGIHRNALDAAVRGESAREAFDGGFGARIEGVVGNAGGFGGDGGGEYYAAVGGERFEGLLGNEKLGFGIEGEDVVVFFFGYFVGSFKVFWEGGGLVSWGFGGYLDNEGTCEIVWEESCDSRSGRNQTYRFLNWIHRCPNVQTHQFPLGKAALCRRP